VDKKIAYAGLTKKSSIDEQEEKGKKLQKLLYI